MEEDFRSGYMECLSTRDTTWWVHEIAVLNAKTVHEPNRYNREVYARVKGYLGIVLYSFTGKALGFNQLEEAEKLLKIYRTLEPENPDMFFFTAIYYDRINKPKEAEAELKQAFDKGFTDRSKLAQMASTRLMATVK